MSPSPGESASNTPMDTDRVGLDERSTSSVPISVPAVRPENCPIAVETSLFPSLRQSTVVHSLSTHNLFNRASESPALPITPNLNGTIAEDGSIVGAGGAPAERQDDASIGQCLADIQSQLDIVNNSVLNLVNPYSNQIHSSVMKLEQTAE